MQSNDCLLCLETLFIVTAPIHCCDYSVSTYVASTCYLINCATLGIIFPQTDAAQMLPWFHSRHQLILGPTSVRARSVSHLVSGVASSPTRVLSAGRRIPRADSNLELLFGKYGGGCRHPMRHIKLPETHKETGLR